MTVLDCSFIHFVYPFKFDGSKFDARVTTVQQAGWRQEGDRKFYVWRNDKFPRHDLMPHVSRYLEPASEKNAQMEGSAQDQAGTAPSVGTGRVTSKIETARLFRMTNDALESPHAPYGLAAGLKGMRGRWFLLTPQNAKAGIEFRIEEIQLTLFRVGVGFLTVRLRLPSESVEDWQDFMHYFRFVSGNRGRDVRAELVKKNPPAARGEPPPPPTIVPFFPKCAGGATLHPDGVGKFGDVLVALMKTGASSGEATQWWQGVFVPDQTLAYAGIFVDKVAADAEPMLLYRARNFFRHDQFAHPSTDDLRPDHPSHLPYAEGHHFVFSLEGGAFISCNPPPADPAFPERDFWRKDLPEHVGNQYFLLYILALHQRFVLMSLSEDVAEHWHGTTDEKRAEEAFAVFKRIRESLQFFTARGLFSQVMQHEHHHRVYRKWQEIFQIERLYSEVSGEVRDMHDQLMMQLQELRRDAEERRRSELEHLAQEEAKRDRASQEQIEKLKRRMEAIGVALAAGVGIPALTLSYFDAASDHYGLADIHLWTLIAIALGVIVGATLFKIFDSRGKSG